MPSAPGRPRPLPAALAAVAFGGVLALACGDSGAPPAAPAPEAPAPRPSPAPAEPAGPPPPTEPAAAPLDLEELESGLVETRAIGVFTKLALKGDIDDLLAALRAHHERGQGRLAELRERFDVLVMKVLSLLQDGDPDLAHALARSRERLWKLLADPQEFARVTA